MTKGVAGTTYGTTLTGTELERYKKVKSQMAILEKAVGGVKVFSLMDKHGLEIERDDSGSYNVNKIMGGGLPQGRIIELFGEPSSGKTTMSLVWAARYTQRKKFVFFVDAEQAFDPVYAEKLGIDFNYFFLMQPDYGEQAFDAIKGAIASGVYSYVVVDSVSALTPKSEFEKSAEDESKIGALARMMSRGLAIVSKQASSSKTTITFINQTRVKIGGFSPFGTPKDTTGGGALKFYTSIRVDVRRAEDVKRKDVKIGQYVKIRTVKNKTFAPFKETLIKLMFDEENDNWGVDGWEEFFDAIVSNDMLGTRGSYFSLTGIKIKGEGGVPGKEMLKNYLKEHSEEYNYLTNLIKNEIYVIERDIDNKCIDFKAPEKDVIENKESESTQDSESEEKNEITKEEKEILDNELINILSKKIKEGGEITISGVISLSEATQNRSFSTGKARKLLDKAKAL